MSQEKADVVIIGAGFAGLSAALFLGNARREVILVDGGPMRNWHAKRSHNVLGSENRSPQEIWEHGWDEVSALPSVLHPRAMVTEVRQAGPLAFEVILGNGDEYYCQKLIFATGLLDVLPDIPGSDEFWPHNLFHCPYCVAPELIDAPLSVCCAGEEALYLASIVRKWTKDLIFLTNNNPALDPVDIAKLKQREIPIINDAITRFRGTKGENLIIEFANHEPINRRGIFMHLPVKQHSQDLLDQLGIEVDADALVPVNVSFETSLSGVFAIGDMSQKVQKISTAIASGTTAGFEVDHQLTKLEMAQ